MINLEQRHSKWMSFAFSQAQKAYDSNEVPVGAVVVYNDKISYIKIYTSILIDTMAHINFILI